MKKEYEILFTPAKIGDCEIKNRFVMEPMAGTAMVAWTNGNGYNPEVHDLLVNRAKDGVGLIIPGAVGLYSLPGRKFLYQHPEAFDGVKETIDEMHSYGSKVFFQLSAGMGRNFIMSNAMYENQEQMNAAIHLDLLNASPDEGLPNAWIPEYKTKQMTIETIEELIHAFAETAYLCKQNGVDGIDIHAVHEGYLMDQFTMPYTNHRADQYGGSLENRLRFPCEVVKAIKERCGNDYPVILRYSVTSKVKGFNHGIIPQDKYSKEIGRDAEEGVKAAQILLNAGYDALNADNGTYDSWYYAHPPVYMPLNCNLKESEMVKKNVNKPVICAGRMQLDEASQAISENKIDFIGIARQFLTDPKYLTKIKEDRLDEIMPCISCHLGCLPVGTWKNAGCFSDPNRPSGICALNPTTRYEKKYAVIEAKIKKHITVIGGGIAGMEFALQAVKRGHSVDLYEKSNRLGGVFNEAASFSFKEKDRDLITWYKNQMHHSKVNVHMNTEIKNINEIKADDYVIATGSLKARNLDLGKGEVVTALDFLSKASTNKDNIVIVGGGLTGCEIAYDLVLKGKKPVIVELQDDILKVPGSCMANTSFLRDAFKYYNVPVYTSTKTIGYTDQGFEIENENGIKYIPAELCIVSIGYDKGIPFSIDSKNEHLHVIGDANKVSNLQNAIWGANDLIIDQFQ